MIKMIYICDACRNEIKEEGAEFRGFNMDENGEPMNNATHGHLCKKCMDKLFNPAEERLEKLKASVDQYEKPAILRAPKEPVKGVHENKPKNVFDESTAQPITEYKRGRIPESEKEQMIDDLEKGLVLNDLVKKYNRSPKSIRGVITEHDDMLKKMGE